MKWHARHYRFASWCIEDEEGNVIADNMAGEDAQKAAAGPELLLLVEALADKDNGIICRVNGFMAALDARCDCWSCDWTRRARAAIAKAQGKDGGR